VPCCFTGDSIVPPLNEATSIQLFRICQEAISNAVRHGQPQHVQVRLTIDQERLVLSIEDDGSGIPRPLPKEGLGLYTMNYRAQMIGATLKVGAGNPCGTVVTCSVPVSSIVEPEPALAQVLGESDSS